MKKIIASVILAVLLTSPVFIYGQKNNTSWISAGAGIKNTWILNQNMYGNPELPYSPKISFSGELSYKHFINEYGYSVGIGIANLGQNYEGEMEGADARRKVSLTYLELPVMGLYNLRGKRQQTWLSVGPQFMYLISAQQDFDRTGERLLSNPELMSQGSVNVIKRFNPVDVMLAFGLTNFFPVKPHRIIPYRTSKKIMLSLSVEGALGLSDINRKQFQIDNMHQIYGASHNFYVGIHIGIMQKTKMPYLFSKHNDNSGF